MTNTVTSLQALKSSGEKFSVIAAYDATLARIIADAGVNALLIGDSLGMVMQGRDSTLPVTVDDIVYHTAAVYRGIAQSEQTPLIIADMPFMSYQGSDIALENAARLMRAGANMVKLEGGSWLCETVGRLVENGIPVCAHLGLTPQSVNKFGGYKVQGKTETQQQQLLRDTDALEQAGASFIVYECIPSTLARQATNNTGMSSIGIGAGADTDAQVLVAYDMLGLASHSPRFVRNFLSAELQGDNLVLEAFRAYDAAVKSGGFPAAEHQYD